MFCPACASQVTDASVTCPMCGQALSVPQRSARPAAGRRRAATALLAALPIVAMLLTAAVLTLAERHDLEIAAARAQSAMAAGDYRSAVKWLARLPGDEAARTRAAILLRLAPAERSLRSAEEAAALGSMAVAADRFAEANRLLPNLEGSANRAAKARAAAIGRARSDLADATAAGQWAAAERIALAALRLDPTDPTFTRALQDIRAAHSPILVRNVHGIALVDPTTGATRLVPTGMAVTRPTWNPDRTQVSFLGDMTPAWSDSLWVVDPAGGPPRKIVDGVHMSAIAVWSPDGQSIAYTGTSGDGSADGRESLSIHVVDVATGVDRNLTAHIGRDAVAPSWAPDGRRLAFVARPDGGASDATRPADVMTVDLVTLEMRNLTRGGFPGVVRVLWSPAGDRLLAVGRSRSPNAATGRSPFSLATIDANSGEVRFVRRAIQGTSLLWSPAWSPDGRRFAYVDGATDVIVVEPSGERRLDTGQVLVGTVSWSPGGREILVPSGGSGRPFVVVDTGAPVLRGRPLSLTYTPDTPFGVPQWGSATQPLDPAPPGRYGTALDHDAATDASATFPD